MFKNKEQKKTVGKLSPEDFLERAIRKLRTDRSKGIHTVYSGLNSAFGIQFKTELEKAGMKSWEGVAQIVQSNPDRFVMHPAKGGAMVYLAHEAPERKDKGASALSTILAD